MHDRNGNMTLMPGLKGKFDAWNRLVEVCDASDVSTARYDYNGRDQRIKKTTGDVVTKSFFNEKWQELESHTVQEASASVYVWGVRYIDDLVLRQRGNERLYSLADPNWNVVALTNTSGMVQERMRYDAFGTVTWLDSAFATKTNSDFAWNRTFTGQVLDSESSMMLYRNRYYHAGLGRFVTRDPIGYEAKDVNLFRYVSNEPLRKIDPLGTTSWGDWWNTRCCAGVSYDRRTHCCEDDTVVERVNMWRCHRPIYPGETGFNTWFHLHSYICCAGINEDCYNMTWGVKEGDSIPEEPNTSYENCNHYKVCPANYDECCNAPIAPWSYNPWPIPFVMKTCNTWSRGCVSGGIRQ